MGWAFSVAAKLLKITPIQTFFSISGIIASQILLLASFFLPLKVIILLGMNSVPANYFDFLHQFDKKTLIILLSTATFLCYATHIVLELLVKYICRSGAMTLLTHTKKLNLRVNINELASNLYFRFTRATASGVFSLIGMGILLFIYPWLCLVVSALSGLILLIISFLYEKNAYLRAKIKNHLGTIATACNSIAFLLAFLFIVIDHIYYDPPSITLSILSLLLARQILQRILGAIQDLSWLYNQRQMVIELFFHSYPQAFPPVEENPALSLLDTEKCAAWIKEILKHLNEFNDGEVTVCWYPLNILNIYTFVADCHCNDDQPNQRFLVKFFDTPVALSAHQESYLLSSDPLNSLPALKLKHVLQTRHMICHLFQWRNLRRIANKELEACCSTLSRTLLGITPSEDLTERYMRSHLCLEHRFRQESLETLKIVVTNATEKEQLDAVIENYPKIMAILKTLPKRFYLPSINANMVVMDEEENKPFLTHWADWRIEPIGAGWPLAETDQLAEAFEAAALTCEDLKTVKGSHVLLSASIHAFERFHQRNNFLAALYLVPTIMDALEISQPIAAGN